MPVHPFLTIASFPGQVIELSCTRCGRRNIPAKARLARMFGDMTAIPELIARLSGDCPFRKKAGPGYCRASLRFPGDLPHPAPVANRHPAGLPRH